MTPVLVGGNNAAGVMAGVALTIDYAQTPGNFLAFLSHVFNASGQPVLSSVADNTGLNVWHYSTAPTVGQGNAAPTAENGNMLDFIAWTYTTAAITSVTATTVNGSFWRAELAEFSGVPPFWGSWTTEAVAASVTPAGVPVPSSGALALAAVDALNGPVPAAPPGWTQFGVAANADICYWIGPPVGNSLTAAGPWSSSFGSGESWAGGVAVFGSAGGGELGGRPPRQRRASYRFAECKTSRIRPVLVT